KPPSKKTLRFRDPHNSNEAITVQVGDPVFFLSPSQKLTSGPPTKIPANLNLMKAYRVANTTPAKKQTEVEIETSWGPTTRKLDHPIYVCIACEEWHHEQHMPIKNETRYQLVYASKEVEISDQASVIDQFGLNKLTVSSAGWVSFEAALTE
ncbi:hypothetical protein N9N28_12560, partial [Rubripirellula amarantea]|nr:hypothetical protein [Rubripirellula amarantea]